MDVSKIADENGNIKQLLMVVDIFSSYAWVIPVENKKTNNVINALKTIIKPNQKPQKIWSDNGGEFISKAMQDYLKKQDITWYATSSGKKCVNAERKIRFLRQLMTRLQALRGNNKYIDVLDKLVDNMNHTPNSMRGKMTPDECMKPENTKKVFEKLYPNKSLEEPQMPKVKYDIGDTVKITYERNPFAKEGSHYRWSPENFTIEEIDLSTSPTTYILKDANNKLIKGKFYDKELQKIKKPDYYEVETILEEKGRGKNKHYLVKWVGYDDSFNSWIPVSELTDKEKIKF
jgi:transposase InsO family protein